MPRTTFHNTHILLVVFAIICLSGFTSCEKTVNISLSTGAPSVVVEGGIETGQPPIVILTSSIGYFATVDLSTVQNSFIHGAIVTVSDGTKTVTLKEYALDTAKNNKYSIYTLDTANLQNIMLGEVEKYYTLSITYQGKTYTSITKIPNPQRLDSVWIGKAYNADDKTPPTFRSMYYNYTDPDTLGNYVRYFTSKNNEPFYAGRIVFTDNVVNGVSIKGNTLSPGTDGSKTETDSSRYYWVGDTVKLKWCNIDKETYKFWNTFNFSQNAVGNPFSSPINAQGNISNGALGVWAGYGSTNYTLIVR